MSLPGLNADLNAMKAGGDEGFGAAIPVKGAFAGSFQDPTKGREIANQLFGSGIDFIQTDGAATDAGVIRAASEGGNRVVSAVFRTQFKLGPKTVAVLGAGELRPVTLEPGRERALRPTSPAATM